MLCEVLYLFQPSVINQTIKIGEKVKQMKVDDAAKNNIREHLIDEKHRFETVVNDIIVETLAQRT